MIGLNLLSTYLAQCHCFNPADPGTPQDCPCTVSIAVPTPSNLKVFNLGQLLSGAIGFILVIAALAAFIFLIWGGIQWITSGGDKASVEAARSRILAAIIGLFVVFAAWALMTILGQFFGFDITNLSFPKGFQN